MLVGTGGEAKDELELLVVCGNFFEDEGGVGFAGLENVIGLGDDLGEMGIQPLKIAGVAFFDVGDLALGDKVNACDFPAIGTYFNTNDYLIPGPGYEHGFFYNLVEASQEVGERPTAAFPSSHVGISTIVMIMAWRINHKLAYVLAPFYILLCCATVYIQAHYLIDALVGFGTAFFVYQLATLMYKRWFISPVFRIKE